MTGDRVETVIERVADLENPVIKVTAMGFMLVVAFVFIVVLLPVAGGVMLWRKMRQS
jgi:hypothetical protein